MWVRPKVLAARVTSTMITFISVRVVAVGVDDERRDRAELLASLDVRPVSLGDRRQHHVPPFQKQRVENLLLGGEVVIDEPVGDPGLVGDIRNPAGVKTLPGKDPHRRVEDHPTFVDGRRRHSQLPFLSCRLTSQSG